MPYRVPPAVNDHSRSRGFATLRYTALRPRVNDLYLAPDYLLDRAQAGDSSLGTTKPPTPLWPELSRITTMTDAFNVGGIQQAQSAIVGTEPRAAGFRWVKWRTGYARFGLSW